MAFEFDGWSIVPRYNKCRKPGCEICVNGKGHGPYYYGTKRVDGKKASKYFGKTLPDGTEPGTNADIQKGANNVSANQSQQIQTLLDENSRLHAEVDKLRLELEGNNDLTTKKLNREIILDLIVEYARRWGAPEAYQQIMRDYFDARIGDHLGDWTEDGIPPEDHVFPDSLIRSYRDTPGYKRYFQEQ